MSRQELTSSALVIRATGKMTRKMVPKSTVRMSSTPCSGPMLGIYSGCSASYQLVPDRGNCPVRERRRKGAPIGGSVMKPRRETVRVSSGCIVLRGWAEGVARPRAQHRPGREATRGNIMWIQPVAEDYVGRGNWRVESLHRTRMRRARLLMASATLPPSRRDGRATPPGMATPGERMYPRHERAWRPRRQMQGYGPSMQHFIPTKLI